MAARFSSEARTVCLVDVDPAFAHGLGDQELAKARPVLMLPTANVPNGTFDLAAVARRQGDGALLLILSGALARDVRVLDRTTTQLFAPGELLVAEHPRADSLGASISFHAERPTRVALLNGRFHAAARVWPSLSALVHRRLAAQSRRLAVQAAILALPRVESRVLAILWHLAETFGTVRADGVLVALPLTHERLGRLVGAQRPTVTLALRSLFDAGDAVRVPDGWMLRAGSDARLQVPEPARVANITA